MTTTEYDSFNRTPSPSSRADESRMRRYESLGFGDPQNRSFPPPPPMEPLQGPPAMVQSVSLTPAPRLNPFVHSNPGRVGVNAQSAAMNGVNAMGGVGGVLMMQRNVSYDTAHRMGQRDDPRNHYFAHPLAPRPKVHQNGPHRLSLHGAVHSANGLQRAGPSPLFIAQSSSDSVFAEIEDAGDWKAKYRKLKAEHDRLEWTKQRNRELQQTVDRLVQRERERERERQRESGRNVRFKEKLVALHKELSGFNTEFYADKLEEILDDTADPLMIRYEVKRLQTTNGALAVTLQGITAFIERKVAPDIAHYDEWDMNEVIAWIKTLDAGRYIPYCDVLRRCLLDEGVFGGGSLMLMDDPDDLKEEPWCIQAEADRVGLIQHFQSLPALKSKLAKAQ